MEHIDLIKNAIARRLVLAIEYEGHVRLVEPCTLKHSLRGVLLLGANWVSGYSKSGDRDSRWRQYDVAKIETVDVVQHSGPARPRRARPGARAAQAS